MIQDMDAEELARLLNFRRTPIDSQWQVRDGAPERSALDPLTPIEAATLAGDQRLSVTVASRTGTPRFRLRRTVLGVDEWAHPDEKPKPRPTVVRVKAYLHEGGWPREDPGFVFRDTGVTPTDEELERIGRPLYEVTLELEVNLATGAVTLIEARL